MLIEDVEFLRGLEWQRMESMGLFFCEVNACKCEDMQADHVEMHYKNDCPTCTPVYQGDCICGPDGLHACYANGVEECGCLCSNCNPSVPTECEVLECEVLGCQCFDKHLNHTEMHRVAMEEIEEGIKNNRLITKQDGCPTCTPTWYVGHRWVR